MGRVDVPPVAGSSDCLGYLNGTIVRLEAILGPEVERGPKVSKKQKIAKKKRVKNGLLSDSYRKYRNCVKKEQVIMYMHGEMECCLDSCPPSTQCLGRLDSTTNFWKG